jgi:aerobic-type carbon monoxide dehydrogenase small subunit (CoxS/CutS family)
MRFILNGDERVFNGDHELTLLDYMRTVEGIPVTKVGCTGSGRCGACAVLMDDRAVLSCKVTMEKVADARVSTTDEQGQRIQDIFSLSLRKMGLAECGYCVPETVLKARIFLEKNSDPTFEQTLRAIERHLCHCIGNNGVARSLMNAAEILKEKMITSK